MYLKPFQAWNLTYSNSTRTPASIARCFLTFVSKPSRFENRSFNGTIERNSEKDHQLRNRHVNKLVSN